MTRHCNDCALHQACWARIEIEELVTGFKYLTATETEKANCGTTHTAADLVGVLGGACTLWDGHEPVKSGDILPCPNCGSKAEYSDNEDTVAQNISCTKCAWMVEDSEASKEDIYDLWNKIRRKKISGLPYKFTMHFSDAVDRVVAGTLVTP